MNALRRYLGGIFAFATLLLAWPILFRYRTLMHAGSADPHFARVASFYLGAMFLNGAAAWAVFTNKRSARLLGIIASTLPALIIFAEAYRSHLHLPIVPWVSIGFAVAGLIAFLPRSTPQSESKTTAPVKIPGDGTIPWIGKAVWIVGAIGFIYGLNWWSDWARTQGLSQNGELSFILQLVLVDLIVVLVHELGHTVTGLALGMKLRAFIVGPFQWRIFEGRWEFKFQPAGVFSTGGATALVPTNPQQSVWDSVCMIAAGPFVNIASGVLALCAAFTAPGRSWEPIWLLLAVLGIASVLVGVLNLVPFQTGASYSDGAQLYQILSGGPWADYHRVVAVVASTLVTSLRPRDYDIDTIKRTTLTFTQGNPAILLHLLASDYHLDRGEFDEASFFLKEAERVYKNSGSNDTRSGWFTAFAFRKAFLHHDAAEARIWWERVNANKTKHFNVDYWLAAAALHWVERSFSEARLTLQKAEEAARQLPKFGAYELDRYRCELLRQAINRSSGAELDGNSPSTFDLEKHLV